MSQKFFIRLLGAVAAAAVMVGALSSCEYEGTTGPRVAVLGDSILKATDAPLLSRMTVSHRFLRWNVNGARIDEQIQAAQMLADDPPRPDILIVELGTNDAAQGRAAPKVKGDINAFLATVLPTVRQCVIWFNLKVDGIGDATPAVYNDRAPKINAVLAGIDAAQPKVRVFDYAAWAAQHPDLYYPDGIHPNPAGARALAAETVT